MNRSFNYRLIIGNGLPHNGISDDLSDLQGHSSIASLFNVIFHTAVLQLTRFQPKQSINQHSL